jgi:hypothetical protein
MKLKLLPAWVFVLGAVAFLPVLWVWFLGDDFGLLRYHEVMPGLDPFATERRYFFYRPLSTVLTWNLQYALFGTSSAAYHLVSLLLHALAAWLLARVVALVSGDAVVGWLAGALYAVYPLCTEPVAWLAAQWDLWAAVCVLGAVWGFAYGWRTGRRLPYVLGLLAATAAMFMKEIALPLPLVLPFVALAATLSNPRQGEARPRDRRGWWLLARRCVLWSLPYSLSTLLFVAVRYANRGNIGGYPTAATDFPHFFWNSLVNAAGAMLMPLNRATFGGATVQVAGAIISAGFFMGLFVWGRERWPLHLLALAWWLTFLAPVLNLLPVAPTTLGNRVLHMSLMGFCVAVAGLLGSALRRLRGRRVQVAGWMAVGLGLALFVAATWQQLQSWVQASRQAQALVSETADTIASATNSQDTYALTVQGLPADYNGAYLFVNAFDDALAIFGQRHVRLTKVEALDPRVWSPPADVAGGINLAVAPVSSDGLYHVASANGWTAASPPPNVSNGAVWDYTSCASRPGDWQARNGSFQCASWAGHGYATMAATSDDPQLLSGDLSLDLTGARWVRVQVVARVTGEQRKGLYAQWYWRETGPDASAVSEERTVRFALDTSGEWRTYWAYVPAQAIGGAGVARTAWRFDPANAQVTVDIRWMAISVSP